VFKSVVAMRRMGAPTMAAPSEGASVRVDLRRSGAKFDAVVTPKWGTPIAYDVTESSTDLKLTGTGSDGATVSGNMFGYVTDKWKELRLARDAAGGLSGGVQGSGEETILTGDVIDMATLTTGGSIAPDGTLPELRSDVSSPVLPAGQLLPWDTIRVRAVEGIAADKFAAGLSVGRANPDPNAPMPVTTWVTGPTDATSWAGAVTAAGKVASWDEINGIAMLVRATGAAVVDRAGHNMANAFSAPFTFIDLNVATTGYPLGAAPTPVPAKWGDAVTVHGMAGADPVCESGMCLVVGPFDNNYCGVPRNGVAGRLGAPPTTGGAVRVNVRVRYRILTATAPGATPGTGPAPFSIDVTALGIDPKTTEIASPALRDLGAAAGEMRYASDFLDAVAPGPDVPSAAEFGFAIYAGTRSTISCGPGGGLLPPPVKTELVIDKITIEPG
jgi:hypothetical protein